MDEEGLRKVGFDPNHLVETKNQQGGDNANTD